MSALAFLCLTGNAQAACKRPAGMHVLRGNAQAVVWVRAGDDGHAWIGCWKRTGRRSELISSDDIYGFAQVDRLRLAGRWAAWVATETDHYGAGFVGIRVADLEGTLSPQVVGLASWLMGDPPFSFDVTSFALDADGGIAWRTRAGANAPLDTPDKAHPEAHDALGILDARGGAITDAGAPGSITGLRVNGDTVTWRDATGTRSEHLQGRVSPRCRHNEKCWR